LTSGDPADSMTGENLTVEITRSLEMTTPLNTSQEGMAGAQAEFGSMSSSLTGDMQVVNNEMLVLQNAWRGQASGGFGQAMDRWENALKRVIDKLNEMIEVTGGSAKTYQQAEDTAYNTAKSWGDGLTGL
jgi:WXG100 family type VII secretion target